MDLYDKDALIPLFFSRNVSQRFPSSKLQLYTLDQNK